MLGESGRLFPRQLFYRSRKIQNTIGRASERHPKAINTRSQKLLEPFARNIVGPDVKALRDALLTCTAGLSRESLAKIESKIPWWQIRNWCFDKALNVPAQGLVAPKRCSRESPQCVLQRCHGRAERHGPHLELH